uniref:HAD family hydrolase n=1 Tax=Ascaris lumbricoides TaxID=6252 RepID=A0A0M3I9A8_ASCLU
MLVAAHNKRAHLLLHTGRVSIGDQDEIPLVKNCDLFPACEGHHRRVYYEQQPTTKQQKSKHCSACKTAAYLYSRLWPRRYGENIIHIGDQHQDQHMCEGNDLLHKKNIITTTKTELIMMHHMLTQRIEITTPLFFKIPGG